MRPDASTKLDAPAPKKSPTKTAIALVTVAIAGLLAVVVLVVVVLAHTVFDHSSDKHHSSGSASAGSTAGAVPRGATPGGQGIEVYPGKASASAKTVDVYEDFQCPICKMFESATGAGFEKLAADGKIKLKYHVMSFLDDKMGNSSSKDAANAAFCAARNDRFLDYHNVVFAHQPEQEGTGYTTAQLKDFGQKAGLKGSAYTTFSSCVDAKTYRGYVAATERAADAHGIQGTPTVEVDGRALSDQDMQDLVEGKKKPADVVGKA